MSWKKRDKITDISESAGLVNFMASRLFLGRDDEKSCR